MTIKKLTLNPFGENTYILSDDNKKAIIIDPGNSCKSENEIIENYIRNNKLEVVEVFLTHAHLDHIFGLTWCLDTYDIGFIGHESGHFFLESFEMVCGSYGIEFQDLPPKRHTKTIDEGQTYSFGNLEFDILHCPGHSPDSICLIHHPTKSIFGGDVIFQGSIGRTDLPLGNHDDLIKSIKEKLFQFPDDYTVYSGHGAETTLGYEKSHNPFVKL